MPKSIVKGEKSHSSCRVFKHVNTQVHLVLNCSKTKDAFIGQQLLKVCPQIQG